MMQLEIPHYIRAAVREYNRLRMIPKDQFPGHRPIALCNQVAFIGEHVAAFLNQHLPLAEGEVVYYNDSPVEIVAMHSDTLAKVRGVNWEGLVAIAHLERKFPE